MDDGIVDCSWRSTDGSTNWGLKVMVSVSWLWDPKAELMTGVVLYMRINSYIFEHGKNYLATFSSIQRRSAWTSYR